jgi:cysteine desulfurase
MNKRCVYLDCNATTPIEPRVSDTLLHFFNQEFGNAGSRTHEYGTQAKIAVQHAREQVAAVVEASNDEVIFTSGATESNNLAILGLADELRRLKKTHIITTSIEHKAVLEPFEYLSKNGFTVSVLPVGNRGFVDPEELKKALRPDTGLVSIMQANNETGVLQPIEDISSILSSSDAFFHVDAAQGFGKEIQSLRNKRIDLTSISAHKIYGPKGVGALIMRRRGFLKTPVQPLMYGGGQERGLRPGTLPVPLIAGFGVAAQLALENHKKRADHCTEVRRLALKAFEPLNPLFNGDQTRVLPHVLNISFKGVDSEAVMVVLKEIAAISNGSACTSASYKPSHVLSAMGFDPERISGALRISWCHLTPVVDWEQIAQLIQRSRVY